MAMKQRRSISAKGTYSCTLMAERSRCTTDGPPSPLPSSSSSSPFNRLAKDHILSILLLLPTNSILAFSVTCKRFSSLTRSDFLWEAVCKRDWGHHAMDALNSSPNSSQLLPWKKLYRQLHCFDSVCCHKLLTGPDSDDYDVIPNPRASHSLNFVSECLIIFGGGCEGGRHLDDSWVAYMSKDLRRILKWEKVVSGVPTGRFGHSCVSFDDSLVLFGGINDQGGRHNDTWVGQLQLNEPLGGVTLSWRLVDMGPVTPPPRGAHAGCCIEKRKMIIHGGIGLFGVRLEDTWVLHLSENLCFGSWQEIVTSPNPAPQSRSGHTLTHIGGSQVILFGGRGKGYEVLDDVWLYEASEERWVQLPFDLRTIHQGDSLSRVGHSACRILGGRVLIFGGEVSNRHRKNDFWVLDISSMSVKTLNNSSSSGGCCLSTKMWRKLKGCGDDVPDPRSFHRACVDNSGRYLYVFGGMVDDLHQPPEPPGLRFDSGLFLVELVL